MKNRIRGPSNDSGAKIERKTSGDVIILSNSSFWATIEHNMSVIVDCYADWCLPCKQLEPIFAHLAQEHTNILFGRINVDHAPSIARTFQIQAIPLILFFNQGKLVNRLRGLHPYNTIKAHIQKYME